MKRPSLKKIADAFKESRVEEFGSEKGAELCTRFDSAMRRYVGPGLGSKFKANKRMSKEEAQDIDDFFEALPAKKISGVLEAMEIGFTLRKAPDSSRRSYGSLVSQFVNWATTNYPELTREGPEEPLCPKMHTGRGGHNQPKTTKRCGRYKKYASDLEELPALIQQVFKELRKYALDVYYPGRVVGKLGLGSFERYERQLRMLFAFRSRDASNVVPVHSLTIQDVCPHLTEEEFEQLSRDEQYSAQKKHANQIESLLLEFFAFRDATVSPLSPSTRGEYISVMLWFSRFFYRQQVRCKAAYLQFPVEQMLKYQLSQALKDKREDKQRNRQVVDISLKYPDFQEGQTQLESTQAEIIEALRTECYVRNRWKTFRQPRGIATSQQRFIVWYLLGLMPARRQQDLRNLKLANSCLLYERPRDLPDCGFIFPMPSPLQREQDARGFPSDNFLIHVYEYENVTYEHGAWLWILDSYKTASSLGSIVLEIPNFSFKDGSYFYQHLEKFFFGVWTSRLSNEAQFYQGDDKSLQGKRGLGPLWAVMSSILCNYLKQKMVQVHKKLGIMHF